MCNNPLLVEIKHRDISLRVFKYFKKKRRRRMVSEGIHETNKIRRNISIIVKINSDS